MTGPKAVMADWLALHGVTAQACRAVLARAASVAAKVADPDWAQDPGDTWRQVADFLTPFFPAGDGLAQRTWTLTRTDFSGTDRVSARAFTLHDDGTGRPVVVFWPKGRLSDLTTLAHEFGHAAQIVASGGAAMPPALREVCACLAEHLVLKGLAVKDPETVRRARRWRAGRGLRQRQELWEALDSPDATYCYDWNYPLARAVVAGMADLPPADLARLFAGRMALAGNPPRK